jgi:hypothetical protein
MLPQQRSQPGSNPESQGWPGAPVVVQDMASTVGHCGVGQASEPVHDMSHRHELAQLTAPHADVPLQLTSHRGLPQLICPHAAVPVQVTSQRWPAAQSTLGHAPVPLHLMVHANPAGQAAGAHALVPEHSIRHVIAFRSHDVHAAGHAAPSRATQ